MTLFRAASRTLLASYFVVSGVKAVKDPTALVGAAEPLTDRLVPLVKQYAPAQIANVVPEDTATLVRINGALQLAGGLALASGKGRRVGALLLAASLVPSTLAKHPFWTRETAEERAIDRSHFLKNASLLGGVLIAAGDTEGRPSLAYRAHSGGQSLAKDAHKASDKLAKKTGKISDAALAEGALLVGTVVASTRKAKKVAAKELKHTKKAASKQLKHGQKQFGHSGIADFVSDTADSFGDTVDGVVKQTRKTAKEGRKTATRLAKEGRAAAEQAAKDARAATEKAAKESRAAAEQAAKDARKQAKKVGKKAEKVTRNIQLGEN